MQTFRECFRGLEVDISEGAFTCAAPLTFADLVLAVGDNQSGVLQKAGANRTVSFAGCHGQVSYAAQLCPADDELPLTASFRIGTALMVLPLQEGSPIAPALIPNIMQTRSMLSVVYATQSDSERRILWARYDRLHWMNIGATTDPNFCDSNSSNVDTRLLFTTSAAMAVFGRTWPSVEQFQCKSRARLTEREGLFLVRNIVFDPLEGAAGSGIVLSVTTDSYLRFAVK